MKYSVRHDLENGWHIEVDEYFKNGWGVYRQERHYNPQGKLIYKKEWEEDGSICETWYYYKNGELLNK